MTNMHEQAIDAFPKVIAARRSPAR